MKILIGTRLSATGAWPAVSTWVRGLAVEHGLTVDPGVGGDACSARVTGRVKGYAVQVAIRAVNTASGAVVEISGPVEGGAIIDGAVRDQLRGQLSGILRRAEMMR